MELRCRGTGTASARSLSRRDESLVLTGPRECGVQDIDPPIAVPGGVIIDVHRAGGVAGTDIEFYIGQMPYLHEGHAQYADATRARWMGTVSAVR